MVADHWSRIWRECREGHSCHQRKHGRIILVITTLICNNMSYTTSWSGLIQINLLGTILRNCVSVWLRPAKCDHRHFSAELYHKKISKEAMIISWLSRILTLSQSVSLINGNPLTVSLNLSGKSLRLGLHKQEPACVFDEYPAEAITPAILFWSFQRSSALFDLLKRWQDLSRLYPEGSLNRKPSLPWSIYDS